MKNTMKLFGFFLFALTLSLMSCKGEDGAIGPAGPAGSAGIAGTDGINGAPGMDGRDGTDGADGAEGEKGAKGVKGNKGDDGNANVFSSDWEELMWTSTSSSGSHSITAPEITADALDKALILGFVRTTGSSGIFGLPLLWFSADAHIMYYADVNLFQFYFGDNIGTLPSFEGRYVVIPPAGRQAAEESANPKEAIVQEFMDAGVDLTDYEQVAKYLDIRP